jgi:hypothetical protein
MLVAQKLKESEMLEFGLFDSFATAENRYSLQQHEWWNDPPANRSTAENTFVMWFLGSSRAGVDSSLPLPSFGCHGHHPHESGHPIMRYALLIHYPQPTPSNLSEDQIKEGMAAFQAYARALDDAGVLRSAEVLQTIDNATSVSVKQGKLQVQDGPFADTKEAFAGIFMLDVPDLDAALAWAEKCPAAHWGTVEIRPSAVRFIDGSWNRVA